MLSTGTTLNGRYNLIKYIAPGGMGEVWEAIDITLERTVAIKTVNENYLKENPKAIKILHDEAKTGAKLIGHPNIVCTLDFGEHKGKSSTTFYIVMEYINGITAQEWIDNQSQKVDSETKYNLNLLIAWEIVKALEFAHRKGILHRDIKPLNIFLSEFGISKMGDFGISRFIEAVTRTHTLKGSLSVAYAATEQWKNQKYTEETDLYQLGCTLYHLFSCKLPFPCSSIPALINSHLSDMPEPLHKVCPQVSGNLSTAISGVLEKEPDNRKALWELYEAIAQEIKSEYQMIVTAKNENQEVHDKIQAITEFEKKQLAEGPFKYTYKDFSEVLSEGIQLILAGIYCFKINKIDK